LALRDPRAPSTVPRLTVARPAQPREDFELSKTPVLVGRIKTNDIVIVGDSAVSREHCAFDLDLETQALSVRDLGSSNGTFVNGVQLGKDQRPLKPGDRVQVGGTIITYTVERPSVSTTVRRLKPQWQNRPWAPREGEEQRTVFGPDFVLCGRCGEKFSIPKLGPGEKVGCVRCRAVWKIPVVKADGARTEPATVMIEIPSTPLSPRPPIVAPGETAGGEGVEPIHSGEASPEDEE
jgi:pSer/pThr/pTyr-binding forkhead associated (FHA) protein